jgi:hypothetical protein
MRAFLRWVYDDFLDDTSVSAKIVLGGVLVLYLFGAFGGGGMGYYRVTRFLVLPVMCTLLAQYLEGYRGWAGHSIVTEATPAVLIRGMGWFLLLLPMIVWLLR